MAGNTSAVSISSNALILLGHQAISSFEEATVGATIASNLYETSYLSLLTNHRWRFATKQATLARLSAKPNNTFVYQFQIPTECIYLIKTDSENYEIFGDKIYANTTELKAEYIFRVNEGDLPPYFIKAMELYLAAQFALPITGDVTKTELFTKLYDNIARQARHTDSTQRPQDTITYDRYIDVRH